MIRPNIETSKTQTAFRVILGSFMLLAGIGHLTFQREEFHAQVPDCIPLSKDLIVVLSGIIEIMLGVAMLFASRWKVWVGFALAVFYVLIFPGNIHQYINGIDAFGLDTDRTRLIRLFFQPVLFAWALWSTGAVAAWKQDNL